MAEANLENAIARPHGRSWFVQNVLPLFSSLAFHAAVLGVGFLMYQSVKVLMRQSVQAIVPDSGFVPEVTTAQITEGVRGPIDEPSRIPRQLNEPTDSTDSNPTAGQNRSSLLQSMNPGANSETAPEQVIGPGPGSGFLRTPGTGPGEGGPLAAFGLPQTGGSPNIFINSKTPPARSVAFLCDASGSMLAKFASLRLELSRAVQSLKPSQSFAITFFGDKQYQSLNPQLLIANPENKVRALNFLEDVVARGPTEPLPALELAFKQKPQLIFLLTDGDFPDNDAVLSRIRQLNRDRAVKINTIAFVNEGDTDTEFIHLLKQIADENGGTYRHVTQDDLR